MDTQHTTCKKHGNKSGSTTLQAWNRTDGKRFSSSGNMVVADQAINSVNVHVNGELQTRDVAARASGSIDFEVSKSRGYANNSADFSLHPFVRLHIAPIRLSCDARQSVRAKPTLVVFRSILFETRFCQTCPSVYRDTLLLSIAPVKLVACRAAENSEHGRNFIDPQPLFPVSSQLSFNQNPR